MMEDRKHFGTLDYVIFALTLVFSSTIGIYFAYRQRKMLSSNEYLLANKSVPWFPSFVSTVASFFSAIGLMGTASSIYTSGITFTFIHVGIVITIIISAELFVPFFRKLELVSANEVRNNPGIIKSKMWCSVFPLKLFGANGFFFISLFLIGIAPKMFNQKFAYFPIALWWLLIIIKEVETWK